MTMIFETQISVVNIIKRDFQPFTEGLVPWVKEIT